VEATLAGDPIGAPVAAQEVHDVVFRVRFGGYDEWQVDLHLDRVERQLSELEERGGVYPRGLDTHTRPADRIPPPPERMMPERMPPPPPMREERMPPLGPPPPMPARPVSPMPPPPVPPGYGRYDEPTYAGAGDYDSRRSKDMTSEIRMPEGGLGGAPMGPGPTGPGQMGGMAAPAGEVQRIDQLRRTFQLRRFGSGYDRAQVDRLFDMLITALSGRSGMSVSEAELDPGQFNLVPGGYFEAEVDAALKEIRDMLSRRR